MTAHRLLMTLLAASIAATGCTTINPYTGEEQTSSAAKGGAIGAAAGALVGVLPPPRRTEAKEL